ncbi:MAG TPA: deoxyribose-phosphate aldolase [Clostridia bacterium]|nr:deoxyribose-phosphate aldolase [Clostridia bacterium]
MDKTRRLSRIFREDGRTLIVAMDHAAHMKNVPGLNNLPHIIEEISRGGADAILTTFGIAQRFSKALSRMGLILRLDGAPTELNPSSGPMPLYFSVEDALRIGADAVAVTSGPGCLSEHVELSKLARVSSECFRWGMPLLAEMVPGGFDSPVEARTSENVALAARIACELGADIVKAPYVDGYSRVTSSCYVPVVILGGARRDSALELFKTVRAALDSGAKGVAMGRNVWGAPHPTLMTRALASIIHENVSPEEAVRILEGI